MVKRIMVSLALVAVIAGCSSGSKSSATAPSATTQQPAVTTTVAAAPAKAMTAEGLLAAFKASGLPVGTTVVYTADNDPNHQMGRPGGYTSKVNFRDTRTPVASDSPSTSDGGSIEVFANNGDAQARSAYIQSVTKGIAVLTEYDYIRGTVLLRLGAVLTPTQADQYRQVLEAKVAA